MDFGIFSAFPGCCSGRKAPQTPASLSENTEDRRDPSMGQPYERAPLGGVGIVFKGGSASGLVVTSLTPGGPAQTSNKVQMGDVLQSVNGNMIAGMDDKELARQLLGPVGSEVKLGLLRRKSPMGPSDDREVVEAVLIRGPTPKGTPSTLPPAAPPR